MSDALRAEALRLAGIAISLDNDVWGNPRYYLPAYVFTKDGRFYQPKHSRKYRGKRFGQGWVFTTWNLEESLYYSLLETSKA